MAQAPAPPRLQSSPFLSASTHAELNSLAILHLKRDLQVPCLLRDQDERDEGYDEGKVTNTRFGSFPHSTLIGVPWGSQVRASAVDTGSRGRQQRVGQKRKRGDEDAAAADGRISKAAVAADTGFAYLLPPTPESWTASLPHRTQVVYTPDYSYILQRIRARPGSVLIEAGAGSGSFTHAAARAVFNGYWGAAEHARKVGRAARRGRVFSFEFHEKRVEQLRLELEDHGLSDVVTITHRDVYNDGFNVPSTAPNASTTISSSGESLPPQPANDRSPRATSVFLDLPAPWLALPHLTRQSKDASPSSLHPSLPVHICTFSPCIEQVTRTVAALRAHNWVDIEMVEISARRLEFRRERVGLQEEGLRGVNASPASVEESIERLAQLEKRQENYHTFSSSSAAPAAAVASAHDGAENTTETAASSPAPVVAITNFATTSSNPISTMIMSKQARLTAIRAAQSSRKLHLEGRLISRSEPDLKTHTSYLVFATLLREWAAGDEERVQEEIEKEILAAREGSVWGPKKKGEKSKGKAQKQPKAKKQQASSGG